MSMNMSTITMTTTAAMITMTAETKTTMDIPRRSYPHILTFLVNTRALPAANYFLDISYSLT